MTKEQLVYRVASTTGITQKDCRYAVEAMVNAMRDEIMSGGEVTIRGLGTLKVVNRKPKVARNISTGEALNVPEHRAVKFIPAAELKKAVYNV